MQSEEIPGPGKADRPCPGDPLRDNAWADVFWPMADLGRGSRSSQTTRFTRPFSLAGRSYRDCRGVGAVAGAVAKDRVSEGNGYRSRGPKSSDAAKFFGQRIGNGKRYRDPARPSDAIFFARGGYGVTRLLDRLASDETRANPKIHLGASDLTALFAFLWARARQVTFYGPMVAVEMAEGAELDWESLLAGEVPVAHRFSPSEVIAAGRGEGPLVGGCLSLLASLAGTPEAVRGEGAVLFWEDVGEETYRLDRMLTQLERSGTFDGLQAMVIGSIAPGGRSGTEPAESVSSWLRSRFENSPFPVAFGFPAGHLAAPRTLPLGCPVRLDTTGPFELVFLGAGVELR